MKVLKCEYCGNKISVTDDKCPHCGASVANVLDEHQKEVEQQAKQVFNEIKKPAKIVFVISIAIPIIILGIIIFSFINFNDEKEEIKFNNGIDNIFKKDDVKKEETVVTVKMNEVAHTEKLDVTLVEYEKYDYKSDFPGYTNSVKKNGYQQIAFHLQIKNNTNNKYYLMDEIYLLADSFKMEKSDTKTTNGFNKGKDFKQLERNMPSGAINEGWVGFFVDVTKQKLELKIGNNIIITLDNPSYKK